MLYGVHRCRTIPKIADTATAKGLVQLAVDGSGADEEAVLQWGRGLGAPFKFVDKDMVFECRFSLSAVTASKWSIGVGLGQVNMGAADGLFVDVGSGGGLADRNFLGFNSLYAEGADFDGCYKADGQTYQNGATKTKLDALATFTASVTTYHKLGFRYRSHPKTVEWYVDNAMPGGLITPARLTATEVDAATFPDDVLLAPIIGIKDMIGDTALQLKLDWWGAAQLL